jgi:AAA15 family ATPase/GTPase
VDEIENGLHHSILTKVWKVIFQMARTLNVQVFATSHSWDCIESFQDAANSDPGDGVLVRLTANADTVVSTLFREDELKIAARNQIELR